MTRSGDVSVLRDMTAHRDCHRSLLYDVSTMSGPFKAVAAASSTSAVATRQTAGSVAPEDTVLLEILIPVYLKLEDREEVCRELGIFVQTGRGGVNGLSRKVCVRLTDTTDPFFLFELELLEDDYGSFKQRLELLVDFSGFPKYLVSMLNGIASGAMPYSVCFVVDNRDTLLGTLRVLERTEFRTVEHISLLLMRQGDAGQKRYLAERFQHFERAYMREVEEHRSAAAAATANIESLKSEVATLQEGCDSLREELRLEVAKSEKNQLASVSQLREEHANELARLRSSMEAELRRSTCKADEVQARLMEDVRTKDKNLYEANRRVTSLESSIVTLQSQLRVAEDKCSAQAQELEELRSSNHELQSFRSNATRSICDNELHSVKLQERVRGLVQTLKSRDDEVQSLREQYQKQDSYIRIITSQNDQLTEQNKKNELSLKKAHHIIATQLNHIKGAKERERMMRNQLRSQDALLQDKVDAITRLRDELSSSSERGRGLQEKNIELRDQLGRTDAAREKLAQELKQSQDALIHLQRSTSVNGRHWSVLASTNAGNNLNTGLGMGLSNSFGSTANDIYREFNKNAMTTVRNAGCLSAQGPLDVSGVPAAHSQNTVNTSENNLQGALAGEPKYVSKASQDPPHSANNKTANSFEAGAQIVSGNSMTNLANASESHIMNGKYTRQPLDATTVNVALNSRNHLFAAKNFFNDGGDKANRTLNTASFMEKTPGAMAKAAAAPSAYF
ncbi:spindle assembly 6 [Trypanosoma rangeli]|uniref:Spindle assembly 6 n=1 Tax=Trypanosoma rangeli TaxID=5698 RepID=A0A422NU91_TRYRA|nr:spindle assembly 6 [Trypanosoma rangeli]RNF09019.1 spindle assembly 6 [Trypanosoma rangeli]|eukprot:RNF09019.1 spindle assembly 6 [Trypanosoma rangeli]